MLEFGTDSDDSLEGDGKSGFIDARSGHDTVIGSAINEEIVGGSGDDNLDGGVGSDTASFTDSDTDLEADLVKGEAESAGIGFDTLTGIENVSAGGGDDFLRGDDSDNRLDGGAGDDWIRGSTGNDTMTGGTGADEFVFAPRHGHDVITDFEVGTDFFTLLDGRTIDNLSEVDSDGVGGNDSTLVTFDDGGTVLLETVLGLGGEADLF